MIRSLMRKHFWRDHRRSLIAFHQSVQHLFPPPSAPSAQKIASQAAVLVSTAFLAMHADSQRKGSAEHIWGPAALHARRDALCQHQAMIAERRTLWIDRNQYFYGWLREMMQFLVEPSMRVLHVRCQTGLLLDAVRPRYGVGIEVSKDMAQVAQQKYPHLTVHVADPDTFNLGETFDYIIFDQISDTVDVLTALRSIGAHCTQRSRLILYSYNPLWQPLIQLAEWLNLKVPSLNQNWLSEHDLQNLLNLADFEWLNTYTTVVMPFRIPLLADVINRLVPSIPILNRLCLIQIMVTRPRALPRDPDDMRVSVVVPCKNEFGNIEPAVQRIPEMGKHTEIIFCDDQSTDGTADEVRRMQHMYPQRDIQLRHGPGISKSHNVWTGFDAASGDILMILDADLAVMPEELPPFVETMASGKAEMVNGTRLIYPLPRESMKFANMVGNTVFGILFSYLLDQPISDTLCGTKVIWRDDWLRIKPYLHTWGVEDRWGDYEILFGAARLHLKMLELPVHYQERIYGASKMVKVVQNGLVMLRMCLAAFIHFKLRLAVGQAPAGAPRLPDETHHV